MIHPTSKVLFPDNKLHQTCTESTQLGAEIENIGGRGLI